MPRHGAVPPRRRVAVVRAHARSVCTTAWTSSSSGRRTRTNGRACERAWTCPATSSSSCSRAGSATRRIRKRSCAPWRWPVERGLDAVLLNLGGGHREFLALAARLGVVDRDAVLGARAPGRASDEGSGRLLSRRRRRGAGVARGRRGLLDARSAGLRDARRRHGGGRDGGAASRLRLADASP